MDAQEKRKIRSTRETLKESVRLRHGDHYFLKLISAHFAYSYRYPILFPHYTCILIVHVYGTDVIDMIREF